MPSCVLHFQTPLDCYPSTHLIPDVLLRVFIAMVLTKLNSLLGIKLVYLLDILCTNGAINASIHLHASTSLSWILYLSYCPPYLTLALIVQSYPQIKSLEKRTIGGILERELSLFLFRWLQSRSKPIRDQVRASENDGFETAVLEDMGEQGIIDGIIIDREDKIDENEFVAKHTENETKSNNSINTSTYGPSLDLPIALRKGTRSCIKHSIFNYVSYEKLSPQFRAFTANLDSTIIPKNINIALECLELKNIVPTSPAT
ncbi:reverse transcriptase [Cucumis melo var. makuwa]|uniref:Reverse transcriptase n=1 Tax=Cucumis melo var. makuwa TaxID=1194695 RepID=A0A5A7UQ66_CUCMM|nr:reverse transcriptase [Cucumis melo var. makuwa]TYK29078.1 reverse transcriptase [Cucumis melo var. makuwa]